MKSKYKNLVFSGGGVLGIAYLGALEYLYKAHLISSFINLAGTSAGAITACLTSFNLPFKELADLLNTLDYSRIPVKDEQYTDDRLLPKSVKEQLSGIFDNIDCVYRLIKSFGWYSSEYIYSWLQKSIALQFDPQKKAPPYTFTDFKDPSLHINNRSFKELYIVGADVCKSASAIFSADTTPDMEVAEAVRISMSVPLLFESIKSSCSLTISEPQSLFIDGGILYNYPINLFDKYYAPEETLGIYFNSTPQTAEINNLVDFISSVLSCSGHIQDELFLSNPSNKVRSICIQTGDISPFNFNITTHDATYDFLYTHGYRAAEIYFSLLDF